MKKRQLWRPEGIKLFMDVSTYCNAACPQCHRTNPKTLEKNDWLPLVQWSLEDFKKAFPLDDIDLVSHFHFCGTWGDPLMIKEIVEIVSYITRNSFAFISIDTNGSMRNEDFFWDLGVMAGKDRLRVNFDVDGINQEMHERYRRKTELSKVLSHMETLAATGVAAHSQTILFKHNVDYKDEIRQLCYDHGSQSHQFVISDRFGNVATGGEVGNDHTTYHNDEDGNPFTLERAPQSSTPKGFISGTGSKQELDKTIVCRWAAPRNEVVVNLDGQVLPCCYHQNAYHWGHLSGKSNDLLRSDVYEYYLANKEEFNLFHSSLPDILNHEWYTTTLPNSMLRDKAIPNCERNCSTRRNKIHQLRERHDKAA